MVAEVTKTGRNETLQHSYPAFVERLRKHVNIHHVNGVKAVSALYGRIFNNEVPPNEAYVCTLYDAEQAEVDEIWIG